MRHTNSEVVAMKKSIKRLRYIISIIGRSVLIGFGANKDALDQMTDDQVCDRMIQWAEEQKSKEEKK